MLNLSMIFRMSLVGIGIVVLTASPQAHAEAESKVLTAADGWPVHIDYYSIEDSKEAPVVILIPGAEGREKSMTRKVWNDFAEKLNSDGYAVVTVDLRKHGDSIPEGDVISEAKLNRLLPADYVAMAALDLEAVKTFLTEEHQAERLNIRKLGIATCGSSGLVAATFAVSDWNKKPWPDAPTLAARTPKGQDVRAILMLSPRSSVKGLNSTQIMRALGTPAFGIAVHVYYKEDDRGEKRSADQVFKFLDLKSDAPEAAEVRRLIPGPASSENYLKGRLGEIMNNNMSDFFEKNLKELDDPWRSRKSRLVD